MASDSNSRFTGSRTHMDSRFAGVDQTLAKHDIRMEALHKNAMSRLDNRLSGASDNVLAPLFNLDTGEEIQNVHTRAHLDRMTSTAIENCLNELGISPERLKEDRLRQLNNACGTKTSVYFGAND